MAVTFYQWVRIETDRAKRPDKDVDPAKVFLNGRRIEDPRPKVMRVLVDQETGRDPSHNN